MSRLRQVRLRVAENPNSPIDVLRKLAGDLNHDVRIAVAANPACEPILRFNLANDADVVVRHGLAQNIDTPRSLLLELSSDENGWVRGEALKTLQILDSRPGDEVGHRRDLHNRRIDQSSFVETEIAS